MVATHRDLPAAIKDGAFRADLYHRLGTIAATAVAGFAAGSSQDQGHPGSR
jgi:hypothetical protein